MGNTLERCHSTAEARPGAEGWVNVLSALVAISDVGTDGSLISPD